MENESKDYDWVGRVFKRFSEVGTLMPDIQRGIYESIGKEWCPGRTVVDLGCGLGIGSNILSHTARSVWGIDVNRENIEFAIQAFRRPNLDFAVLDIESPPTRELSNFEVIICIEVIEHLKEPFTGLGLLKTFMSNKLETKAFVTVPNVGNPEIKERDAANELHLHRWTAGEFYDLMIKHFRYVTMFDVEKLNRWTIEETVSGDTKVPIVIFKLEGVL